MKKVIKIVSNSIYIIGTSCVIVLLIILFLGDLIIPYDFDKQMVPASFSSWLILLFGTIPMNIACFVTYVVNDLRNHKHKIRDAILVFLPGIICLIASLSLIIIWLLPLLHHSSILRISSSQIS